MDDLLYALQDADETVRANAIRSLEGLVAVARERPTQAIRIPSTQLVELLNSVVLSDRVESVKALLTLTRNQRCRARSDSSEALPSLAEMARWKTNYALAPFRLLGRVAGLPDAQVSQAWDKGDREER